MKGRMQRYELGMVDCRATKKTGAKWEENEWHIIPRYETFQTIEGALKAITERQGLTWKKEAWMYLGQGRFISNFKVDEKNEEVTDPVELEKWKRGERELWLLQMDVKVYIVTRKNTNAGQAESEGFGRYK